MFRSICKHEIIVKIANIQNKFYHHAATDIITTNNKSAFANRQQHFDFSLEYQQLRSVYPLIIEEVIDEQLFYFKNFPKLRERYSKLMDYTCFVDDKYLATPICFLNSYKLFQKSSFLTEENMKKACILAWCFRLSESSMIMDDDIIDNSMTRYNKPTWYNLPDVGINKAICDASFIETSISYLLLNHFSLHPQYFNIQRELLRSYSSTMIGLYEDTLKHKPHEFEKIQNVEKVYPFTVPVVLCAMYLANIDNPQLHIIARNVLMDIAVYLKMEDDVEGVYGKETQKDCTDVAEGRVTWLATEAYKRGTDAQKKILKMHYSTDSEESLIKIYNLYDELNLKEEFDQYTEDFYNKTYKKIQKFPEELPKKVFLNILDFAMIGGFRS